MNSQVDFFYFFIGGAALLLSALGLWFVAVMPGIDRWSKRFFLSYFGVLLVSSVSVLVGIILQDYPVPSAAVYFLLILETLLLSLPLPMQTAYLLHCCGENLRESRLLRAAISLWVGYFVLLVSIPFIGGASMSRRITIIIAVPCIRLSLHR